MVKILSYPVGARQSWSYCNGLVRPHYPMPVPVEQHYTGTTLAAREPVGQLPVGQPNVVEEEGA